MAVFQPTYKDPNTGEQKRSKVWWYEFTIAGKRVRESAKTTRKTIAQEAEKNKRLDMEKALAGMPVEKRENRILSVKEVVDAYLKHYSINHRKKSVQFAENRLDHVKRLLGTQRLPDLTESAIKDYIVKRQAEEVSGRTINAELGELSRAVGKPWSVLWPKVRKLEERKDVGRALSPEEEKRLLDAAARRHSPVISTFVRVAVMTGMRFGEIAALRWRQVDLIERVITVGESKTTAGTGRQIPIGNDLQSALSMHLTWFRERFKQDPEPNHYLFPFGSPTPSDPTRPTTTMKTAWGALREAAGVSCRMHDLRHTAATKMAEAGVPESTMLAILGHMSRAMLERYSHIRMKAKREAVEAMGLARQTPKKGKGSNGVPKVSPKVKAKASIN